MEIKERGWGKMRLRVITRDKKFVDYDVELPIYLSTANLKDKFAVIIVEEKKTQEEIQRKTTFENRSCKACSYSS